MAKDNKQGVYVKKKKRIVWQKHHLSYKPETVVYMQRKEHYYITILNRFTKPVSKGFLIALEQFILWKKSTAFRRRKK